MGVEVYLDGGGHGIVFRPALWGDGGFLRSLWDRHHDGLRSGGERTAAAYGDGAVQHRTGLPDAVCSAGYGGAGGQLRPAGAGVLPGPHLLLFGYSGAAVRLSVLPYAVADWKPCDGEAERLLHGAGTVPGRLSRRGPGGHCGLHGGRARFDTET